MLLPFSQKQLKKAKRLALKLQEPHSLEAGVAVEAAAVGEAECPTLAPFSVLAIKIVVLPAPAEMSHSEKAPLLIFGIRARLIRFSKLSQRRWRKSPIG
jgi:hypothetical protein